MTFLRGSSSHFWMQFLTILSYLYANWWIQPFSSRTVSQSGSPACWRYYSLNSTISTQTEMRQVLPFGLAQLSQASLGNEILCWLRIILPTHNLVKFFHLACERWRAPSSAIWLWPNLQLNYPHLIPKDTSNLPLSGIWLPSVRWSYWLHIWRETNPNFPEFRPIGIGQVHSSFQFEVIPTYFVQYLPR